MSEKKALLCFNQNTDFIKLVAVSAMLLDHLGKIFFKETLLLQIIGRISFPIFAYCLSVGATRTRDIQKYMVRLAIFAIVTQPIYILAFLPELESIPIIWFYRYSKNVLFSLLTGLIGIYGLRERNWLVAAAAAAFAYFGHIEYGIYGFLLILGFYVLRDTIYKSLTFVAFVIGSQFFLKDNLELFGIQFGMNVFGLMSIPLIYFNTNINLRVNKYFFYIFYPFHFIILFLIQVL